MAAKGLKLTYQSLSAIQLVPEIAATCMVIKSAPAQSLRLM